MLILVLEYLMAKIKELPRAQPPGPPPEAWFVDPFCSGLCDKPLRVSNFTENFSHLRFFSLCPGSEDPDEIKIWFRHLQLLQMSI